MKKDQFTQKDLDMMLEQSLNEINPPPMSPLMAIAMKLKQAVMGNTNNANNVQAQTSIQTASTARS